MRAVRSCSRIWNRPVSMTARLWLPRLIMATSSRDGTENVSCRPSIRVNYSSTVTGAPGGVGA